MKTADDVTVFVVDDDPGLRSSLKRMIGSVGLPVVTLRSGEEFLERYDGTQAGCIVLDVRMRGMSGLDLQDELARRDQQLPIIFISAHGDVPMAVRAVQRGALDFLEKPFRAQVLLDRVHQAIEIDRRARAERAEAAAIHERLERLSPRERQVAEIVADGLTSREIAARLHVSHKTVDFHRSAAMDKTDCGSIAELTALVTTARLRAGRTEPARF